MYSIVKRRSRATGWRRTFAVAVVFCLSCSSTGVNPTRAGIVSQPRGSAGVLGPQSEGTPPVAMEIHSQCRIVSQQKECRAALWVQPFTHAAFYYGSERLKVRFTHKEKTMARADLALPNLPLSTEVAEVRAVDSKTGGTRIVSLKLQEGTVVADTPLLFFDAPAAKHRFLWRIATGKQPKSAQFIAPTRIVLPLLDDDHLDAVDILTQARTRVELPREFAKREGFVESVLIPSRGEFWVSQMSTGTVHRFLQSSMQYVGSIPLTGKWTKVLALDPVTNMVYASNWLSDNISVISVETLKEVHLIKTKGIPRGMAFTSDGKQMLAAVFGGKSDHDNAGGTVMIDLATEKPTPILKGGAHRHAVRLPGAADIFAVSDMARNRVYFIENGKKTGEVRVFSNPNTIVASPDGKYLYVSCRGHNNAKSFLLKGPDFGRLLVVDIATRQVVEEIEAGNQPTGLDVSPDGRFVVLTDFLDRAVRVYERLD